MAKKFKFKIENDVYDWDTQTITGAQVRTVGPGIPETMDLFIKKAGMPGRLVKNEDIIDLEEHGIEKFYTHDAKSDAGV